MAKSHCFSEAYPIIAPIKLSVVAGDEICPQDPERPSGGRDIQAFEGDNADVCSKLWLLQRDGEV